MKTTKPLITLKAFAFLTFAATVAMFPVSATANPQATPQNQNQDQSKQKHDQAQHGQDQSQLGHEQSWNGKIEQRDNQGMKSYVLMVAGQAYPLDPQAKAADFDGKTVKVTGKMEAGKVVIRSIEEAETP